MKKIIALAVSLVAAVTLATAEVTVGARGSLGLGLGTTVSGSDTDLVLEDSLDWGFAFFANIPVAEKIGIQPEIGMSFKSIGAKVDTGWFGSIKGDISYTTIDIPVLVTYEVLKNDAFSVNVLAGPKFSIPVGKAKYGRDFGDMKELEGKDKKVGIDSKCLYSIVVGADASYAMGPGAIVADLRYDFGLNKLKSDEDDGDIGTPRALALSLGYQMKF